MHACNSCHDSLRKTISFKEAAIVDEKMADDKMKETIIKNLIDINDHDFRQVAVVNEKSLFE